MGWRWGWGVVGYAPWLVGDRRLRSEAAWGHGLGSLAVQGRRLSVQPGRAASWTPAWVSLNTFSWRIRSIGGVSKPDGTAHWAPWPDGSPCQLCSWWGHWLGPLFRCHWKQEDACQDLRAGGPFSMSVWSPGLTLHRHPPPPLHPWEVRPSGAPGKWLARGGSWVFTLALLFPLEKP